MGQYSYAPVIIPTLNRYEHFKRCLESLEKCTGADKTVVYVGLDYPPSERYVEGWKQIDEYLTQKEIHNKFCKLIVNRRSHNLGIKGDECNDNTLIRELDKQFDTFIYTEDDNEFSVNFLEYINKGLDKYRSNKNVFLISGYNYPIDMTGYNNNIYCSWHCSAWGAGFWINKRLNVSKADVLKFVFRPNNFFKLLIHRPQKFLSLIAMISRGELYGDSINEIYSYLNNWVSIFPTVSKVRNWGRDGSGQHGYVNPEDDPTLNQPIDSSSNFEIDDIELKDLNWKPLNDYFKHPLSWYVSMMIHKIK